MRIYGHRGARGEAPENTIAGFLHAKAAGVAGIETDIALTADLIPVLHHDPRLADGRLIRDCARDTMPELPTLREALLAVPDTEWLLEIKTFADKPALTNTRSIMADRTLAILKETASPPARIKILSFDWEILRICAALAPQYQRICLTEPSKLQNIWWGPGTQGLTAPEAADKLGATAWAPRHDSLTPALAHEAHTLGLQVYTWTVNDLIHAHQLQGIADALITDVPAVISGQRLARILTTDH